MEHQASSVVVSRLLSYSEITKALTCQAQWDFAYGGQLAGSTLKRRELAPILGDGRAWGAAVAAYHAAEPGPLRSLSAVDALNRSLDDDYEKMIERGFFPDIGAFILQRDRLYELLQHYMASTEPLPNLTRLEGQINVPIPSRRGGGRRSSRYRFQAFIDGWAQEYMGHKWIVEYKLRATLQDVAMLELGRQPLWYGWGLREVMRQMGLEDDLIGVIIDERLNEIPKPARVLKSGKPSHAKDQLCTVDAYIALCEELGDEPRPETVETLSQRKWQQRVPIVFRPGELDEAGLELVSAAETIRDLDGGRYPVRNARPQICRSCEFRRICKNPQDELFIESLFERTIPKRLRSPEVDTDSPRRASSNPFERILT